MNVCISIAEHEIEMAHRWMDWVSELGCTDGHSLYLIPASGLNISALIPKSNKAFGGRVHLIKDEEQQTSDWQNTEQLRSASGPNSAFRQVAWHFYHGQLGPYFWCELDCVPLTKDWLDRLETEYKSCGKPFMGAHVQIESVPEHMSGNAIYVNVPENAPGLIQRTNWTPRGQSQSFELAFDIAGSKDVLPKAHFTNLIQHKFRFKGFESRFEFDAVIDPNAVVFHSDKSGSIYKYLRENLSGNVGVALRHGGDEEEGLGVPPAQSLQAWEEGVRKDYAAAEAACETTVVSQTFTPADDLEAVIKQNAVIKNGLPAMSPPWENREDSERDVKMLCDALKLFCGAPIYKSRVRQALRQAKIIK
jgi:hypothetical protein